VVALVAALVSSTRPAENFAEQVFGAERTGDLAQGVVRSAQDFSAQFQRGVTHRQQACATACG
jgi:hypothetical protein